MSYKINYSVYKITNLLSNQSYIGVDSYFPKRLNQHKSLLLKNKHKNNHLQSSYNKNGLSSFNFELLENCSSREEMLKREIYLISHYNSFVNGFNHTIGGEGSFGYKHSKESIIKMSSWKRIVTPEWCEAISKANLGKKKKEGIKRINHPDYSKWLGGEKHPVAKFKKIDIDNIRKSYNNGISLSELSFKYKTAKTYVCSIVNNSAWYDKDYVKNVVTKNIICIEDERIFKSSKEVVNHYEILNSSLSNNLVNKSKFIKTKYGKKSFKRV